MPTHPRKPTAAIPVSELDTRALPADERFGLWRESFAPLFDVHPGEGFDVRGFRGFARAYALPTLIVAESACATETLWRGQCRPALRGDPLIGDDPVVLHLHLRGSSRAYNGDRELRPRPGDISLTDLARPYRALDHGFRTLSLVIPRISLLPLLGGHASPGGLVLAAGSARAEVLASHLRAVWRVLPQLNSGDAPCITGGLIAAVAHAFGPSPAALSASATEQALATRAAVADYVERHLANQALGPERLRQTFGCSRSHLYRLFGPLGGVAAYINERRLLRAWGLLTSAEGQQARVIDIAHRCGFSDQSHFSRQFRRRFGVAPREARQQAAELQAPAARHGPLPAFHEWISAIRRGTGGA